MSAPVLTYFPAPGRGELTRLAFAAGGVQFEDNGVQNWPEVKADPTSTPGKLFCQMPTIDHGDVLVGQSKATAVYAAELGIWAQGRLGSGSVAARNRAMELMLLGAHADLQTNLYKCLFGDDASKEAGKKALPETAAAILKGVERVLGRKTNKSAFFFCESGPTLADLAMFDVVTSAFPGLKALGVDLSPYPKLLAVVEAVGADPAIKAYKENKSILTPTKKTVTLYTNPVCPFAQRAWLALVEKGVAFEKVIIPLNGELKKFREEGKTSGQWADKTLEEVEAIKADYKKNTNPTGEVPTLVHGDDTVTEAEVVAEYLDDAFPNQGTRLFPSDPLKRAHIREVLKALSGNNGVKAFYTLLMNQDPTQDEAMKANIYKFMAKFASLASAEGPWFLGEEFSFVDAMFAPFYLRFNVLLPHYRKVDFIPPAGSAEFPWAARMQSWASAIAARPSFEATKGFPQEKYIEFYKSYAGARGAN